MDNKIKENIKELLDKDCIALLQLAYGDKGKVLHIKDELYGCFDNNGSTILINKNNGEIIEKPYCIDYILDKYILAHIIDSNLRFSSVIINRETFEIEMESDKMFTTDGKIIYDGNGITIKDFKDKEYTHFIYDNELNELYSITVQYGYEFEVEDIDETGYYLLKYKVHDSSTKVVNVIYIDFENKRVYNIANTNDRIYSKLSDTLYVVYNNNTMNIFIVDFSKDIDTITKLLR